MLQNKLQQAKELLRLYWGYEEFRELQEEAIFSVLSKRNTLVLLATGGGKSMIYQLPALMMDGVCLVVSPLLALMKDQVIQLRELKISAAYISSELSEEEQIEVLEQAIYGHLKILYVSPERLQNRRFLELIQAVKLSFLAVDEAHCISEWGVDFRPSYLFIPKFLEHIGRNLPVIALTATATPQVLEDILLKLNLSEVSLFKTSFERPNLSIQIIQTEDKLGQIDHFLKTHIGSGLIYCRTRAETEYLCQALKKKKRRVDFFHAGLSTYEKQKKQEEWTKSNFLTLICTNAFGMGINKPDVRFVIHYSSPYSLENYYQEIGRAGRDGQPALAALLWNEKDLDDLRIQFQASVLSKKGFQQLSNALYQICMVAENELPERPYPFDIKSFAKKFKVTVQQVKTVLKFLENFGWLKYEPQSGSPNVKLMCSKNDIPYDTSEKSLLFEALLRNYPGIFNEHQKVDIEKVSFSSGLPKEKVVQLFEHLQKMEYLDYVPAHQGLITFLMPRNSIRLEQSTASIFETHQRNKVFKFEELLYFIQHKKTCRNRMILHYFGQKVRENCGRCDVCLEGNLTPKERKKHILQWLKRHPNFTWEELIKEFPNWSRGELTDELQHLLNEEIVRSIDYERYEVQMKNF